jgi:phosphoribosyl-AMP cyclohydrolase
MNIQNIESPNFEKGNGLLPVIVQDAKTAKVLISGKMTAANLRAITVLANETEQAFTTTVKEALMRETSKMGFAQGKALTISPTAANMWATGKPTSARASARCIEKVGKPSKVLGEMGNC